MLPALQASRSNLNASLRHGGRGGVLGGGGARLRAALVVAEMAVAVALVVGASLFIRSFLALVWSTSASRLNGCSCSRRACLRSTSPARGGRRRSTNNCCRGWRKCPASRLLPRCAACRRRARASATSRTAATGSRVARSVDGRRPAAAGDLHGGHARLLQDDGHSDAAGT